MSITGFVDALQQYHGEGAGGVAVSSGLLRRSFGEAAPLLACLEEWLANKGEAGAAPVPGFPSGVLAHCGGCWRSEGKQLQSSSYDACFKLDHLRSAGGNDQPPDNQRFFVPNSKVRAATEKAGQLPVEANPDDKQCADFAISSH